MAQPDSQELQMEQLKAQYLPAVDKYIREWSKRKAGDEIDPRFSHSEGMDVTGDDKEQDLQTVRDGSFVISNFRLNPRHDGPGYTFHFYIGATEFHLQGEVAKYVESLLQEKE